VHGTPPQSRDDFYESSLLPSQLSEMVDINDLSFTLGCVLLDEQGYVLACGEGEPFEAARALMSTTHWAVGFSFFSELAPWADCAALRGVFEAGMKRRQLSRTVDFVIQQASPPIPVRVRLRIVPSLDAQKTAEFSVQVRDLAEDAEATRLWGH
jgi:hypothetical protein